MNRTELLQRAIHSAKCRIYRINYDLSCDISLTHQRKAENQKELMNITVKALEKQIPKKPIINKRKIQCINGHNQPVQHYKYCPMCGQLMDWSDEE